MTTGCCNLVRQQRNCKPDSRRCQHVGQIDRATRPSGRGGEEALEIRAFGEADGVVDGVAGAVDLSKWPRTLRCSSTSPYRKVLFDPDKNRFLKFDAFLDHACQPFLNALGPM